jgi:hypothetical protein
MNRLVPIAAQVPALVRAAGERAQTRFWEFFVSNIRVASSRGDSSAGPQFLAFRFFGGEFRARLCSQFSDFRFGMAETALIFHGDWLSWRPRGLLWAIAGCAATASGFVYSQVLFACVRLRIGFEALLGVWDLVIWCIRMGPRRGVGQKTGFPVRRIST